MHCDKTQWDVHEHREKTVKWVSPLIKSLPPHRGVWAGERPDKEPALQRGRPCFLWAQASLSARPQSCKCTVNTASLRFLTGGKTGGRCGWKWECKMWESFLPLEKGQSLLHILGLDLHSTLNKHCILVFYNIIKAPALGETKRPV